MKLHYQVDDKKNTITGRNVLEVREEEGYI
jgi:hypothetical protein